MKKRDMVTRLRKWREDGEIGRLAETTLLAGFAYKLTIALDNLIPNIEEKLEKISPEKREKIILKLYELLQVLESEGIK